MLTNVQITPIRVIPMLIVIIPSDLITALVTLDFLAMDKIALVSFFTKRAAFVQWCLAGIMFKLLTIASCFAECSRLSIATISGRRNRGLKLIFKQNSVINSFICILLYSFLGEGICVWNPASR